MFQVRGLMSNIYYVIDFNTINFAREVQAILIA